MRSISPPVQRHSIETLRPSLQPSSASACRNAATRVCMIGSPSRVGMRAPIRRIGPSCCARAASGHAAAPPISVMNLRRRSWPDFICCPWLGRQHNGLARVRLGACCDAGCQSGLGPLWVKTRISLFRAYVSFRQLRTCRCADFGPRCLASRDGGPDSPAMPQWQKVQAHFLSRSSSLFASCPITGQAEVSAWGRMGSARAIGRRCNPALASVLFSGAPSIHRTKAALRACNAPLFAHCRATS